MKFQNKVVIVTGGAKGIGAAIVQSFLDAGASVVIADPDKAAAETLAQQSGHRERVSAFTTDVSNPDSVAAMVAHTAERFGRLDVLINNAGIRFISPFLEQTLTEWNKTMSVNLLGPFLCCQAAIPQMLKTGKGKIVNITSIAGMFGRPERSAYCASKGGAIALTKAIALDMRGKGIYVNALAPALIETPLNSQFSTDSDVSGAWARGNLVQRWGQPIDIANAALFLSSDESDFITGTVLTVDGGWTSSMVRHGE